MFSGASRRCWPKGSYGSGQKRVTSHRMKLTTPFSVLQWIDQLARLERDRKCNGPEFMRPFHFVSLALMLAKNRASELGVPKALEAYSARMGLWESVGLENPVGPRAYLPPEGRFLPLQRLTERNLVSDIATSLADITATYGADASTRDAIQVSMMEVIENCFAHAGIEGGLRGLVCAQSWPEGNLAQIAIADCGVGIRDSLAENAQLRELIDQQNSCEVATRFGITSKPQLGHAGYGLALTRQLLEHAGGRLIVVSGSEWMQARNMRCSTGTCQSPWKGTMVVLEWKTTVPLNLKAVYASWPTPRGFRDDDFDF